MSYPQSGGFQQQPYQQGGGQGGYGGGYNYPAQTGGSSAAAIVGAILGLVTGVLAVLAGIGIINSFVQGPVELSDLPGQVMTAIIGLFAVGVVLIIGAILMFARKVAGAFLILIGAILTVAVILLEPVLFQSIEGASSAAFEFGEYFKAMFTFGGDAAGAASGGYVMWMGCQAIALVAAPIALIVAVIPPSLNWLRGSSAGAQGYGGGYPQQPQQGGGGYQGW